MTDDTQIGTTADGAAPAGASGTTAGEDGVQAPQAVDVAAMQARLTELENFREKKLSEQSNFEAERREFYARQQAGSYQPPPTMAIDPVLQSDYNEMNRAAHDDRDPLQPLARMVMRSVGAVQELSLENKRLEGLLEADDATERKEIKAIMQRSGASFEVASLLRDGQRFRDSQNKPAPPQPAPVNAPALQSRPPIGTAPTPAGASNGGMPAIHIDDYAQQRTRMVAQGNIAGAQALEREVESGRRALIIGPR